MVKQPALGRPSIRRRIRRSIPYYVLILLPLIYLLVFKYYPMLGVQIAFKKYKVKAGIWGSEWIGMKYFSDFFSSPLSGRIILNTYMPYFISTVVLVSMILQFTDISSGLVNQIIKALGGNPVNFMGTVSYFRSIYVWTGVWQTMGYSAIVYLAALTGVPTELYEAAKVDGASKLRRIISIDIPCIAPTIITLFILNTGSILSIGFEKIYLMQSNVNLSVSEVISTHVYKMGVLNFNYSYSTAVGLFNSVVNMIMLVTVNAISNRISDVSVI